MKIGIDIGTSMTKAVLYDDTVAPIDVRSRPTAMLRPAPGHYEHDLPSIVDGVVDLLSELPGDAVDLVSVTGQGDGLWLLDSDGAPARNALSWMDNRGAPDCRSWAESGAAEAIFRSTGNAVFPGAGAALLSALDRAEPDTVAAARTATQCQHAVFQALTGVRTATRSAAMLGVFDPAAGGYDAEALRLTGLDRHGDLLPEVCAEPVATASLRGAVAERTGLQAGVTVATGPYDLPAAAFGAGVTDPGDGLLIVGTTLACLVLQDAVTPVGEPAGLTLCTADGQGYLRAMPTMVGTAGLDWILSIVGATHAELDGLLADSAPGASGVESLPYLSAAGERAPFVDPAVSGQFTGLSLATSRADLVRALCESMGYAARHCLEAAGLAGTVAVCGGGTASAALVSLLADTLGRPVSVVSEAEITARGSVAAAIAASGGTGPDRPVMRQVEPSTHTRTLYQDGYAGYLARVGTARSAGAADRSRNPIDHMNPA